LVEVFLISFRLRPRFFAYIRYNLEINLETVYIGQDRS
jgi:hypothetical protein